VGLHREHDVEVVRVVVGGNQDSAGAVEACTQQILVLRRVACDEEVVVLAGELERVLAEVEDDVRRAWEVLHT